MAIYIGFIALGFLVGAAAVGGIFWVEHQEDLNRPEGYHLKATVTKIVEHGDNRQLFFSFFLKGKQIDCSTYAPMDECKAARENRDYLIVYNDKTKKCIFNPCAKYRKQVVILAIVAFAALAFATLLVLQGFTMKLW